MKYTNIDDYAIAFSKKHPGTSLDKIKERWELYVKKTTSTVTQLAKEGDKIEEPKPIIKLKKSKTYDEIDEVERAENDKEGFKEEIEREIIAVEKEYRFIKSFLLVRPELYESKFIFYISHSLHKFFSATRDILKTLISMDKSQFLNALASKEEAIKYLNSDIKDYSVQTEELDYIFSRMVYSFVKTLKLHMDYINSKIAIIIKINKIHFKEKPKEPEEFPEEYDEE